VDTRRIAQVAWLLALGAACSSAPAGKVARVEELGALQQSPLILGRDGAVSGQAWGQDVWVFGDTFMSVPNDQGFNFVSNTFALSDLRVADGALALRDRLDDAGAPESLIALTPDELAFNLAHLSGPDGGCAAQPCGGRRGAWPGAVLFDPADGGTALAFYGLLSAAPGDFNFQVVGQAIAVWTDFGGWPARPALDVCPGEPLALFCQGEPGFGSAAVEVAGTLYAFGCTQDGFSYPCELGRVPFGQALVRSAWQFWDGHHWTASLAHAAKVFDGAPILSVAFNPHLQRWLALYSAPLSNQVVYRTAEDLSGPWSDEGNLFVSDRSDAGGTTYDALLHPELSEDQGRTEYVTYSRPTAGWFNSEFVLYRVTFE
jgi:hypothetical protein